MSPVRHPCTVAFPAKWVEVVAKHVTRVGRAKAVDVGLMMMTNRLR